MQHLHKNQFDLGAQCQDDARVAMQVLERKARQIQRRIDAMERKNPDRIEKYAELNHQLAVVLIDMDQGQMAWNRAFPVLALYIDHKQWQQAVMLCETLFRSEQADSLVALGHALWLSITFPVEPTLTLAQLQHVIDETPDDSDGAAVAAAMAAYVVDLRGDNAGDDAALAAGQMLNDVARRHGHAQSRDEFDRWFRKLELDDPAKLLVRMRNIIDVLVQDQWWIDRNALQAFIADQAIGANYAVAGKN